MKLQRIVCIVCMYYLMYVLHTAARRYEYMLCRQNIVYYLMMRGSNICVILDKACGLYEAVFENHIRRFVLGSK